jgi:hypothetical protein
MKRREVKEIRRRVEECLEESRAEVRSRAPKLPIASGGTARALARLVEERGEGRATNGGLRVPRAALSKLADDLAEASHEERLRWPGIKRSRADLLPTGAIVLDTLVEHSGCASADLRLGPARGRDPEALGPWTPRLPARPASRGAPSSGQACGRSRQREREVARRGGLHRDLAAEALHQVPRWRAEPVPPSARERALSTR